MRSRFQLTDRKYEKMVQLEEDTAQTDAAKRTSDVELNLLSESRLDISEKQRAQKINKNIEEDERVNTKKEIDAYEREMMLTEDVRCGFWIFKGACFQRCVRRNIFFFYFSNNLIIEFYFRFDVQIRHSDDLCPPLWLSGLRVFYDLCLLQWHADHD